MLDYPFWKVLTGLIASSIIVLTVLVSSAARSHDIYHNWLMPDARTSDGKRGWSCCNDKDCAPRAFKFVDGHWEVEFNGRWIRVPDKKIETSYSDAWDPGDHLGHACISPSGTVFCARPGEWLQ